MMDGRTHTRPLLFFRSADAFPPMIAAQTEAVLTNNSDFGEHTDPPREVLTPIIWDGILWMEVTHQ